MWDLPKHRLVSMQVDLVLELVGLTNLWLWLKMVFAKTAHGGRKLPILGEASHHVETKTAKAQNPKPLGGPF